MKTAIAPVESEALRIMRSELSFEQVRLCQDRLESKQVDCVIGRTDLSGAVPAFNLIADRWWIAVPQHHRGAAAELIAALERAPVRLERHDATWKYACAASLLTMPLNYFLVLSHSASLLTVAVTALVVALAAFYGHQCATYTCSDPDCRAVNDPAAEWCCRCGTRIGDGVDRPALGPADDDALGSLHEDEPQDRAALAGVDRALRRHLHPRWPN